MNAQDRDPATVARVVLRQVNAIAQAWGLSQAEQCAVMGIEPTADLASLDVANARHLERLSHVLNIYEALHTIFSDRDQADAWVRRPNSAPLFAGRCALELMMQPDVSGLASVHLHVASHCYPSDNMGLFADNVEHARANGTGSGDAAREHLAAGRPIYVGDRAYPGELIRVHPDGRREVVTVTVTDSEDLDITVVRPIPSKHVL